LRYVWYDRIIEKGAIMLTKTRIFFAAFAAIAIISLSLAVSNATKNHPTESTGKIQATIVDSASHQPIVRAIVHIVESKQGGYTNDSGIATINSVHAGKYTVVAKYAAFEPDTIFNVNVQAGLTTALKFSLRLKNKQVYVTGTMPLVEKTRTDVATKYSSNSIGGAVLSPSTAYEFNDSYSGSRGYANASRLAISEVDIVSGAADASKGGFTGGHEFNTAEFGKIVENEYKDVRQDPLSTFSIDVDGASYSNVRHFITSGQMPPHDAVRIEEMVNYFKYDYPQPKGGDPFAIATELTECPWNAKHQLALIGLQGKEIAKGDAPPANLTFLLDVSGSMSPENRLPLLQRAFRLLVEEMRPQDKVAIVVYAGAAGLVLPPTSGEDKEMIFEALDRLQAGGSTAGGAGLELAYKVAQENFDKEKNNRVILATDGDFNIGTSNTGDLLSFIEEKRKTGIFFTTIGVGEDNYKDARLKQLADKGNGNYYYIDNILEAKKVFVTQMGGTLNAIAKDVKIQIEFNPALVKGYRLIGYESRILAKEDFNNDQKDAGELGSSHTVTALYEIIPAGVEDTNLHTVDSLKYQSNAMPQYAANSDEVMTVKFRYKKPDGEKSLLIEHPVQQSASHFTEASNNFRFAAAVAQFGMVLRDSKFKGASNVQRALELARSAKGMDNEGYRAEFIKLIEAVQLLDKASR